MRKLIILVVIVAAGYFVYSRYYQGEVTVQDGAVSKEGAIISVAAGGEKRNYTAGQRFEATYMLFGADQVKEAEGFLSGIPLDRARRLYKKYPDFHRCDSAGAKEAQAMDESILVIPSETRLRNQLNSVAVEFDKRIREKGERLCVKMGGLAMTLESIEKGGTVMTSEEIKSNLPPNAITDYVLLEQLESMDCKPLLDG